MTLAAVLSSHFSALSNHSQTRQIGDVIIQVGTHVYKETSARTVIKPLVEVCLPRLANKMSAVLAKLTGEWSTDVLPTKTTMTHIDPTNVYGLVSTLMSLSSSYPTVTKKLDLYHMARAAKGAQASLKVISAQNYIATATATQEFPRMTLVIWNATMELQDLEMGFNLYQMHLSLPANLTFAVGFAIIFLLHFGIGLWSRHAYFSACLSVGVALEVAGYTARILSIGNYSDQLTFLCQIISLTLAPAFIMAGVYFLLAQLLVIHGRTFSMLRPLWFSYIFIICDLSSLTIQACGGAMVAINLQNLESTLTGSHVMVVGIAFQVVSMTLFLYLLFDFLFRIYFRASPHVKFLIPNLFRLTFQTSKGKEITHDYLDGNYNQKYRHIWSRNIFGYYPLVLFFSVFFIYVRCVYRLVELSEGWTGYLITHEEYIMTLDGLMVMITCILLVPFHPGFMMGTKESISMSDIKHLADMEHRSEKELLESVSSNGSNPFFSENEKLDQTRSYDLQVSSSDTLVISSTQNDTRVAYPPPLQSSPVFSGLSARHSHGSIDDGGLAAIPYEYTKVTPKESSFELPKGIPRKHGKTHSKSNSVVSSVLSINPYERKGSEGKFATYGPYEQYPSRLQEVDPFADQHEDYADVHSQITDDDFLFTFS